MLNYTELQLIKAYFEEKNIKIIIKSSTGIGMEYMGVGTYYSIYVEDSNYKESKEIINIIKGEDTTWEN
ncbi:MULTISPECIES: hypothetical protein [Oceanotoga]|jgi:hypothetical protein|uniref:Signal transducing protein n=1 Tax=Oceanotoga teriensis TaxID=515440 RepID=A0AA45C4Q4_9BACT|nr:MULTISPECIES: hypothetical protein [Oceanotoga]MDN5343583.1 hypothetical protein [Oceanotoga sp.]MDO7977312.1 hypothetical protein [Oceanotoga teriensis]PWJ86731.1 hypothetical protein C7380_13014 [Oceanotoga teriensis]